MQLRALGNSDLQVSAVGLGANNFGGRMDAEATRGVIHRALDLGVTLIDTADAYGPEGKSELCIGQALGPRRQEVVLATKVGLDISGNNQVAGAKRGYVLKCAEDSLKRLKTDWIDLYQVHFPDPATPIEETLRALEDLKQQGKVRYIGYSNASGAQLKDAQETARRHGLTAFISTQEQYSLLHRKPEADLFPVMKEHGVGFLPFFPLASGMLTGKYKGGVIPQGSRLAYSKRHIDRFVNDKNWQRVAALDAFAEQRGRSILELAFAWLLANPLIGSVIAGATTPAQVEQNVRAAGSGWQLSAADLAEIDRITR